MNRSRCRFGGGGQTPDLLILDLFTFQLGLDKVASTPAYIQTNGKQYGMGSWDLLEDSYM